MDVIDFEDRAWFLLKNGENYFIDVNCNKSAFGFSMLICLDGEELNEYKNHGYQYINKLAKDITYYSTSKYSNRDKSNDYKGIVSDAIKSWKLKNSI